MSVLVRIFLFYQVDIQSVAVNLFVASVYGYSF